MPRPKRVYRRDWKPSIRGSVSLPRLQLTSDSRPYFECPVCFLSNDRVPVCLWCKTSSPASTAAFWASMPKQRTVSAPMKITLVDMKVRVACAPVRTRSAETVLSTQAPRLEPQPISPVSSRASSRSNTSDHTSLRTSTTTEGDTTSNKLGLAADELGRLPARPEEPLPTPPAEGKFHTLPLRRKGHILRTTAGVVVNKSSRLSALFRKDAVPVLDKPAVTVLEKPAEPRKSISVRPRRQKKSSAPPPTTLPTIPSSKPLESSAPSTYTMPTPPSFLSPFWYRPEEFGRLPASPPTSRGASLDTPRPMVHPRGMHAHTYSEPVAVLESPRPHTWRRRMSGFFRHSVGVVTGQKVH